MTRAGSDIRQPVIAVATAAAIAAVFFLILSAVSTPAGFKARLTALQGLVGEAEKRLSELDWPPKARAGALCTMSPAEFASSFGQMARQRATAKGVILSQAVADVEAPHGGAIPVAFTLKGGGRYEAVVALFQDLAVAAPTIFVDRVELSNGPTAVQFKLTGRSFCSASAHR